MNRKSNRDMGLSALEQNKKMLENWDNGEITNMIEMGGFGPGYEQTLQILTIEIVRDLHSVPLDPQPDRKWANDTIHKWDKLFGFSGAQAGAAKQAAYLIIRDGHEKYIEFNRKEMPDRMIMVSKNFPRYPDEISSRIEKLAEDGEISGQVAFFLREGGWPDEEGNVITSEEN